jgi:hypothetical protein
MSASMEQGNQLLEMATDANDKIRAENKQNFEAWQSKIKQNKEIAEGEDWYHGVTDVLGTHGALAAYYRQGKRASELGVGYTGLVAKDIGNAATALKDAASNPLVTLKGKAQAVGDQIVGVGKSIKGTFFGSMGGDGSSANLDRAGAPQELTPEELDADYQKNVVQGPLESTPLSSGTDEAGYVANPAEEPDHLMVAKPVTVGQSTQPALTSQQARSPTVETGEDAPASSTTQTTTELKAGEDVAEEAGEKEGGSLTGSIVSKLTGEAEGSLANVGVGKALGNIGGGIDIIKDFEGLGQGDSFFSGGKKDATTGEKVSNALATTGTFLDIASIALPFLEPVAATVSVAGAVDGTYQSVKDQEKTQNADKANYKANIVAQKVPPSLAGVGFLASQENDSHKLITGSSAF